MPHTSDGKASILFWAISFILLIWGVLGLFVYIFYFLQTPEKYASGVETSEHQQVYADYVAHIPLWAIGTGVIAALARFFGAIGLLIRRAWALPLYVIALIFFVITLFRAFILANAAEAMSGRHITIEIVFLALSIFAVWLAQKKKAKGVLR